MLYIILILFAVMAFASLFKLEDRVRNILFFACWISCLLIAGLREVGCDKDSINYLGLFNQISEKILVERSFYAISSFVKYCFGSNFVFVLLIYAIIGVTAKFIAIRQLTSLWILTCMVYISNIFILQDMTQMRAGIATAMLLLCIKPLYERNWKLFLTFCLIGVLFHSTALVILPLWFLNTKRFDKFLYAGLIVLAYWAFFAGVTATSIIEHVPIDHIQQKMSAYTQSQTDNSPTTPFPAYQLIRLFVAALLIWKLENVETVNKYLPLMLKIYIFGVISFLVFANIPAVSVRTAEFFGVLEIILIPLLIYTFKDRRFGIFIAISIGIAYLYINLGVLNMIS